MSPDTSDSANTCALLQRRSLGTQLLHTQDTASVQASLLVSIRMMRRGKPFQLHSMLGPITCAQQLVVSQLRAGSRWQFFKYSASVSCYSGRMQTRTLGSIDMFKWIVA